MSALILIGLLAGQLPAPRLAATPRLVWAEYPGVGWGWVQADLIERRRAPTLAPVGVHNPVVFPSSTAVLAVIPSVSAAPRCYTDPRTGRQVCPAR